MMLLDAKFEGNKKLYRCRVRDSRLYRWKKNRQPDLTRVEEIQKRFGETKSVPNIIYVWKAPDKRMYVYDGAHRWEAIKQNPDGIFWMAVFETDNEKLIEEEFITMNKNIPIPELYLQPDDAVKLLIMEVVTHLAQDYKALSSPSRRPRKPAFNRDVLTDLLYDSLVECESDSLTYLDIRKAMAVMESKYRTETFNKAIKAKCLKNNCHLFGFGMFKFIEDLMGELHLPTSRN